MKYKNLRFFMKKKNLDRTHYLKNCDLVIDGNSYFSKSYKNSRCDFFNGAECNKYADFLEEKLLYFINSNVKCYVIFSGCMTTDESKTLKAHQAIIDSRNDLNVPFFEPIFAKDVQREVLEKLRIKYFYCESDATEAIISVARKFKCPVLTNNIEYSLYGVSCITLESVEFLITESKIKCASYDHSNVRSVLSLYNKTPLFLTLLNESGAHFGSLAKIIECEDHKIVSSAMRWVKKQRKEAVVKVSLKLNDAERISFMKTYQQIHILYTYSTATLAVKHFLRPLPYGLFKDDKKWFSKGVACGRIAVPFVNLHRSDTFSGSELLYDEVQPDAMLAAVDIISYSYQLITNFRKSEMIFLGRVKESCRVVTIPTRCENKISNRPLFNERKIDIKNNTPYLFDYFLKQHLPNLDMKVLSVVPKSGRALFIALLHYVGSVNEGFTHTAYCVLLSYVLLGPVATKIRARINNSVLRSSEDLTDDDTPQLEYEDCQRFSDGLKKFFQRLGPDSLQYDYEKLHAFSEFQHCLQHMNYLIRLCNTATISEAVPCTVYHKTYNGTFVYNLYLKLNKKNELIHFLKTHYNNSSAFELYETIVNCFERCLPTRNVECD